MAGLLSRRDQGGDASPVRSRSADWELISSFPNASPPESRDDVFGLEEFKVRTLSMFGSVFESSGFLQDDYFAYGPNKADLNPIAMVMGGNAVPSDEADLSSATSSCDEKVQKISLPLTVSADSGSIDPFSSPHEVIKSDEAIATLVFERRSTASNISIETGVPLTKRFSQGESAPESYSVLEPTTLCINSRFPSQLEGAWYDTQSNVGRIQHFCYDYRRSKIVDEGVLPVAAHDSDAFGSISSKGIDLDALEPSKSNNGGGDLVCVSWIGRQLSLWQAQLARAKSVWTLALAAAVMGLLIVGRGWQRLQAQNQKLRLQLRAKDKKITQLMCQVIHVKETMSNPRAAVALPVDNSWQIPQDRP